MEKMPHAQLVPRSRMAQRFTGSGFKIATETAGMLGSSENPLQDLGPFVLIEPMEKMPYRGDV